MDKHPGAFGQDYNQLGAGWALILIVRDDEFL